MPNIKCQIGEMVMYAEETTSSKGREGFRAQGKINHAGKRYQCQVLVFEIWDKDDPRRAGEAPKRPIDNFNRKPAKAAAPAPVNGQAAKAF